MSSPPCSSAARSNSACTWASSVTSHGWEETAEAPNSAASAASVSFSRRAWASLIRIRAPSSRNLRAVAPPIPAPAAAVSTAVRPFSRPWPGTY